MRSNARGLAVEGPNGQRAHPSSYNHRVLLTARPADQQRAANLRSIFGAPFDSPAVRRNSRVDESPFLVCFDDRDCAGVVKECVDYSLLVVCQIFWKSNEHNEKVPRWLVKRHQFAAFFIPPLFSVLLPICL